MSQCSLATRALRLAVLRIGLVAALAGFVSYEVNRRDLNSSVRLQLEVSLKERLQLEAQPFRQIQQMERNFLNDFQEAYQDPVRRAQLAADFDRLFVRRADGAYLEAAGSFDGKHLVDGQNYQNVSAIYFPFTPLNPDIKARFTLLYRLCQKYGTAEKNRITDLFSYIPEKGAALYWPGQNPGNDTSFTGPDAYVAENFEYFTLGRDATRSEPLFTRMYQDFTSKIWMVSVLTPGDIQPNGRCLAWVGTDISLAELLHRTASPGLSGARAVIFQTDAEGTLIFHPDLNAEIQNSAGKASLRSLHLAPLENLIPLVHDLKPGAVMVLDGGDQIIALGTIPGTPWAMSFLYPKALMRPAILHNLAIVVAVGLITLLVEIFILRSILQKQVAEPLARLIAASRLLGASRDRLDPSTLPQSQDEIGELSRDFAAMANRVQDTRDHLENTVTSRTAELQVAKNEAEVAKDLADAANLAKSTFLANMSHEIRTPMNAVLGYSQILQQAGLPPQQKRSVDAILRAGTHLIGLIDNVLDLSKIEAGKVCLNLAPLSLSSLCQDIVAIFAQKMSAKNLQFSVDIDPATPPIILADGPKLRQVILNLVSNAWKFTEQGEIQLSLVARAAGLPGEWQIAIAVSDSGCGIAADELPRIFDAFVQSSSGIQSGGGTGLGLAISKNFAQLMDGDLNASSTPGQGSTFTFTFSCHDPSILDPDLLPPPVSTQDSLGPLLPGQGEIRLLIVDDNPDNRSVARGLLTPFGFALREAQNGQEALDLAAQWLPQIILMDLVMPVMDGFEALRLLRQRPASLHTCIIALSATVLEDQRQRVLAAGAQAFLAKPYLLQELLAAIAEHSSCRFSSFEAPEVHSAGTVSAANFAALPEELQTKIRQAMP